MKTGKTKPTAVHLVTRIEVFAEGDQFVGLCRDLSVSSCGDSPEEARRCTREALELFVEECGRMGTLEEVLGEAGYAQGPYGTWRGRDLAGHLRG
jgi:predicted RNase H-like HicB family nuclease